MKDEDKTKDKLIGELAKLRQRIAELERSETQRKQMENILVQERDLLQALIDNIPDLVYFKDDKNRFIRVNKARAEFSGTSPQNMLGKTDFDFFPEQEAEKCFSDDNRVIESDRPLVNKVEKITHVDGTEHWVSVVKMPRHNEKGEVIGTMGISRDVTERRRAEEIISHMAYHDSLTDLPNRALFNDRLTLALAHAQRNRQLLAVMLLDLDYFKEVNDTLGHSVGDKLLQAIGDRLTGLLRESDTIARMGGDEFLFLLPEIARVEDAAKIAQKILEAIRERFVLNGHELHVTTSIGITIYPNDSEDAGILMRNADIAMYRAKEKGRNNYQHYAPV